MKKPHLNEVELLPDDGYAVACRGAGTIYYHHAVVDDLRAEVKRLNRLIDFAYEVDAENL